MRIGFIGLGKMGARMAARLASRFPVRAFGRAGRPAGGAAEPFSRASSPRACAEGCDVIVTMLSDGPALLSVLDGKGGVLAGLAPGALVLDMATSGRAAAIAAQARVASRGGSFVDAPVSGTLGPAERGELLALVGAEPEDLARAEPVLRAMCRGFVHAGPVGQGQALKVVLNGLGAHHLVAFASMLALGERAGLSREVLLEAFTTGAFASPSYVGKKAKVLAGDYTPEFTLAHTAKDVGLTAELAREVGMAVPVVDAISGEVQRAVDLGLGELDLFALERGYPRRA